MTIDWVTPLNSILATAGVLATVVATWFVNRWLRRRAARDAIEEAIAASVALTDNPTLAAAHVRLSVPKALQTLEIKQEQLKEKVAARVASSRGIIV